MARMRYELTTPCDACPFLKSMAHGFGLERLREFASNEFGCHKTCDEVEGEDGGTEFVPNSQSLHCAGALIFLEKRNAPNQMMRICERIGMYDRTKLNMKARVR